MVTLLQVLVRVLDRNDNRPRFDQDSYEVTLTESFATGDAFLTITATDADEEDQLADLHLVPDVGQRDLRRVREQRRRLGRR